MTTLQRGTAARSAAARPSTAASSITTMQTATAARLTAARPLTTPISTIIPLRAQAARSIPKPVRSRSIKTRSMKKPAMKRSPRSKGTRQAAAAARCGAAGCASTAANSRKTRQAAPVARSMQLIQINLIAILPAHWSKMPIFMTIRQAVPAAAGVSHTIILRPSSTAQCLRKTQREAQAARSISQARA